MSVTKIRKTLKKPKPELFEDDEIKRGDKVYLYKKASKEQINWGGCDDPNKLPLDEPFVVDDMFVHTWHTKLKLKGINGLFNSVTFRKWKD